MKYNFDEIIDRSNNYAVNLMKLKRNMVEMI